MLSSFVTRWHLVILPFLTAAINAAGSINITPVTNQTFSQIAGYSLSIFSIQSALFSQYHLSMVYDGEMQQSTEDEEENVLFTDACRQADGTDNCTATCNDPKQMFQNLETLHNCRQYPIVATQLAYGNLSQDAIALAQRLDIVANKTNSSESSFTQNIAACIYDSCSAIEGCQKYPTWDDDGDKEPWLNGSYWDFDADGANMLQSLCEYTSYPVNPDIAGIGVCCLSHD